MAIEFDVRPITEARSTRINMGAVPTKEFPAEQVYNHKPKSITFRERRSMPSGIDINRVNRLREIHRAAHEGPDYVRRQTEIAKRKLAQLQRVRNPRPDQIDRIQELKGFVDTADQRLQEAIDRVHATSDGLYTSEPANHGNL